MLLASGLRRSTSVRVLPRSIPALQHLPNALHSVSTPSHSRRAFATSHQIAGYVLARAKVLHLAARTLRSYKQLLQLDSASSPVSRHFARSATLRERVYMYLVCLIPPDQPIYLPEFLAGARHAASAVIHQIYATEGATLATATEDGDEAAPLLTSMASSECRHKWTAKLEAQREALHLPVGTKFKLEKLEVHDAALAEVEYDYSEAGADQKKAETCSMYQLNESLKMKVRFAVTEHLLSTVREGEDHPTRHTLKTTFDWSFYSNVSREHLVDWYITDSTPFKLELATDKQEAKTKTKIPLQI
ncbi:hypothetical protein PHYBOEH_007999 [Phytophthora boehmeriae]|uniref:Uncharacterized protein n=1 Tax=Phytophthora boehmeriae TaxID=109152 RepID=A0A8T1W7R3_9STRA|nr:hypothetical protein PHYBOEH_007999 [Phytophthora boehmeriae]